MPSVAARYGVHETAQDSRRSIPALMYAMVTGVIWLTVFYALSPLIFP